MKQAVVLLSGGMDSSVLCALLKSYGYSIHALSFNYGAKHNSKELACAEAVAQRYCVSQEIIDLQLDKYLKSSLLKGGPEIPEGHYEDQTMKSTVVPFRNGIMLSFAVSYAESKNIQEVIIASHSGDHAIYPDCRTEFNSNFAAAAYHGTYNKVLLSFPFQYDTKRMVALKGKGVALDFGITWSCYKGGDLHCGKCGTCVERKEALAGFDTTQYGEG